MHSSRVRTARLLPVSRKGCTWSRGRGVPGPGGGGVPDPGVYLVPGGGYIVSGAVPVLGDVPDPRGVPSQVLPHCEQNDWQIGVKT